MIAGALSVVLALALGGDPPEAPATPDVVAPPPAEEAPIAAPPPAEASAPPAAPAPRPGQFVAVVRPATQDPLLEEASSRIRSELTAAGLPSRLVDCGEPTEAPCPGPDAVAAIALGRKEGVVLLDVRAFLPDGLELSRHVRVLDRDGGQDPSVLAVRAVELLRDLRLNAQRRAPARPSPPAVDDEEPRIPLPPPPPPRWRLSTGVGMLAAPKSNQPGIWPAVGATLAAGKVLEPRWTAVLTLGGPFNSSFHLDPNNGATLIQALATLEFRYQFPQRLVRPFVSMLSGVNYLHANVPSGMPPISTAWVPLFGGGGGLSRDLGENFSVAVEGEVFATVPSELIKISGGVVGRAGAPSILVTADLGVLLR